MSRERARRRAEREAAAAQERQRRVREQRRRGARQSLTRPLTDRLGRLRRRGRRPASRLALQRRRQNGGLLAVLFAAHLALWLATSQWSWRLGALVLTVLAWPVLVTVLFDRRPRA